MTDLSDLAKKVSDFASNKFKGEIAIIALYGSIALGTESNYSDLDMYAITDSESEDVKVSFIYDNHPVDLWSMSWKDAERMAKGHDPTSPWCVSASLFINYKLLFSRSKDDLDRFSALQNIVEQTQKAQDKNIERVLNQFDSLFSIEKIALAKEKNDLLYARWAAWGLIINITNKLSWLNNKFYTKNWGGNFKQVVNLEIIPDDMERLTVILCSSDDCDEILTAGRTLISNMRDIVRNAQKSMDNKIIPLKGSDFIHMKEYINKIHTACDNNDIISASYAATELQVWISEILATLHGISALDFNLFHELREYYDKLHLPDLSCFITRKDFKGLKQAVIELENRLHDAYINNGSEIPVFNDPKKLDTYLH